LFLWPTFFSILARTGGPHNPFKVSQMTYLKDSILKLLIFAFFYRIIRKRASFIIETWRQIVYN
jgi:hypothetical protein